LKFNLSLLIAVYNEEKTIVQLLESNLQLLNTFVANQLISDFEIVVLNDGSNDKTSSLLKPFSKNKKIRLITNQKPSGIVNAFNQLYSQVNFDWYILVPGDGQWSSHATSILIDELLNCKTPTAINGVRKNKGEVYGCYRWTISSLYCKFSDFILQEKGSDPGSIKLLPKVLATAPLRSGGLIQQIEVLSIAKNLLPGGVRFVETPWTSRVAGKQSGVSFKLCIETCYWLFKSLSLRR
jgi:glycosyltransferase involved in cell wall biosynthesis